MGRGETSGGAAATTPVQWGAPPCPVHQGGRGGDDRELGERVPEAANAPVRKAVDSGRLPLPSAAAVVSEYEKLSPLLGDLMQEPALTTLSTSRSTAARRHAERSAPSSWRGTGRGSPAGPAEHRQVLHPPVAATGHRRRHVRVPTDPRVEGKSIVEAALGPLLAPQPDRRRTRPAHVRSAARRRPGHPGPPGGRLRGRGRQDQQDHPAADHEPRRPQGPPRCGHHGGRTGRRAPPGAGHRAAPVL